MRSERYESSLIESARGEQSMLSTTTITTHSGKYFLTQPQRLPTNPSTAAAAFEGTVVPRTVCEYGMRCSIGLPRCDQTRLGYFHGSHSTCTCRCIRSTCRRKIDEVMRESGWTTRPPSNIAYVSSLGRCDSAFSDKSCLLCFHMSSQSSQLSTAREALTPNDVKRGHALSSTSLRQNLHSHILILS